jgi:glucose-6-phosphate-specific signal transduction histidine kinase
LADGLGAILTALLLHIAPTFFEGGFGLPDFVLQSLIATALLFAIYSLCCYFFASKYWRKLLSIIATANLLYCLASIGVLIIYYKEMTIAGLVYFAGEIAVVGSLAVTEWLLIGQHRAHL